MPRRLQFLDRLRGLPLLPGRGSTPIVLREGNALTVHLAGEELGDVDTIELDLGDEVDDPASVAEQLEEEAAEALEEAAENVGG